MAVTEPNHVSMRRDSRHHVAMRAQLSVAGLHGALVKLSPAAGAKDGWLEADAVDFSLGGVGVIASVFLPRHTMVRLRLLAPGEDARVLFEGDAVVRRVIMTDRRPAYHVGTSFHDLDTEAQKQVTAINALLAGGE